MKRFRFRPRSLRWSVLSGADPASLHYLRRFDTLTIRQLDGPAISSNEVDVFHCPVSGKFDGTGLLPLRRDVDPPHVADRLLGQSRCRKYEIRVRSRYLFNSDIAKF